MYKYQCTETSCDKICETLNSDKLKDELLNLDTNLNDISVTEAVSNLRQILIKISNESLKKTKLWTDNKHKPKKNYAPWMNDQSKQSKAKLNRARKKYQNAIRSDRTASYLLKFREYLRPEENTNLSVRNLKNSIGNSERIPCMK